MFVYLNTQKKVFKHFLLYLLYHLQPLQLLLVYLLYLKPFYLKQKIAWLEVKS